MSSYYTISPQQLSDIRRALNSIASIINDFDLDEETVNAIQAHYTEIGYILRCVSNEGVHSS